MLGKYLGRHTKESVLGAKVNCSLGADSNGERYARCSPVAPAAFGEVGGGSRVQLLFPDSRIHFVLCCPRISPCL